MPDDVHLRPLAARGFGSFLIGAGIWHFVDPAFFEPLVPPMLPAALFLVYLSGIIEIAVGASLWFQATRGPGAWLAVGLLLAVWPANLYAWSVNAPYGDVVMGPAGHVLRNVLQPPMLALMIWVGWPQLQQWRTQLGRSGDGDAPDRTPSAA